VWQTQIGLNTSMMPGVLVSLQTLRQWSKRYDMLMWDDIFHAMERFTGNLEQRYDPVSGYFYPPSDSRQKPQLEATELAFVEIGDVIT
jgi:hypothetical protein